jgi:hypothetical protein
MAASAADSADPAPVHPVHAAFAELAADERFSKLDLVLTRSALEGGAAYVIRLTLPEHTPLDLLNELSQFASLHALDGIIDGTTVALVAREG